MISLTLNDEDLIYENSDVRYAVGRIQINGFSETFHASLFFWTREDYFKNWRKAAELVLSSSSSSGFITSMVDPKVGCFVTWWPMYREGCHIYVQNALLFLENIPAVDRMNVDAWQEYLLPRTILNEEGDRISEWKTDVEAVEHFLVELNEKEDCRF